MRDTKVGGVMFVVGCDGDTVDFGRFLFENIVGGINGGCQGGFNTDIRRGYQWSFDGWTPSSKECTQ